jgi:hypothetical protein
MEQAGRAFIRRWTGARVEFEQLLEDQQRLWGAKSRPWPLCWDMSDGLGNAMHVDPDGHRSYAVWLSALGHAGASRSWYLLFPRHGLAIELCHGCWISWDGRVQPHCTAVPDVAEGDRLMSLFCSLPANAMNVLERAQSWRDVRIARALVHVATHSRVLTHLSPHASAQFITNGRGSLTHTSRLCLSIPIPCLMDAMWFALTHARRALMGVICGEEFGPVMSRSVERNIFCLRTPCRNQVVVQDS